MTGEATARRPYSSGRIFLIALVFIGAAPLFWQRVEVNPGGVGGARENSDLYQSVFPTYGYGFMRLRNDLPQWNPQQNCGTAFLADPHSGLFQPLNVIFLMMPPARALAMHAFAALALMGVFFALFLRSLGVGYVPALIGGLAYAFSGASAAAMSRPALAATLAWSPFVFWTMGEFVRRARPAASAMAGLGLAALILAGAPALAIVMFLLSIAYAAVTFGAFREGDQRSSGVVRRATGLLLALLLALAASAIQWAPALAWLAQGGAFNPEFWNMHASAQLPGSLRELLLQFPMAQAGTLPRLAYFGIATLLLIPAALVHRPLRRYTILFTVTALASFGALLIDPALMPGGFPTQSFAYPALFSMAALSAIGADRLFMVRREGVSPGPWAAAGAVLAVSVPVFLMFPSEVRGYVLAFLLILAPFLAIRRRWAAAVAGLLIAFLLFVDLMSASDNAYSHPYQDAPQCYTRYEQALLQAHEQSRGGRALVVASPLNVGLPANIGMLSGLRLVGGRDLPETEALRAWRERALVGKAGVPPVPGLLNFAATRVLLVGSDGALPPEDSKPGLRLSPLPGQGDLRIFLNENALPRAYWVPYCVPVQGVDAALDALVSPTFDSGHLCVVDSTIQESRATGGLPLAPAEGLPPGTPAWQDAPCSVEDISPEEVKVTVTTPRAGIVVLSDTFAPAWEVAVDGIRCPALRVNGAFRGVAVAEGRHEITYRYRPLDFELASALSIATLALLSALGVAGLYRAERGTAGEAE